MIAHERIELDTSVHGAGMTHDGVRTHERIAPLVEPEQHRVFPQARERRPFETLLLNAQHVDNVEIGQDVIEARRNRIGAKSLGGIQAYAQSYGMSVYRASDALLPFHRCLFHAAALVWQGKDWLFAADSGVGKSTQIRHWKELYGDQVQILNGDKPILSFDEDARIMVHPSPWKGKEVWGDDSLSAPLGGLILLKQGDHNAIKSISPIYCAARLLSYFFSSFEQAAYVQSLCAMEERMLQSVPVLELVNLGDADSARLTHDYLLKGGEAHGGFSEV